MRRLIIGAEVLCVAFAAVSATAAVSPCQVVQKGTRFELHSPFFVYRLDTADGLKAQSFENRLTKRSISLGNGAELEVDLGDSPSVPQTLSLEVVETPAAAAFDAGEACFELASKQKEISARVTYRWDSKEPVLRKFVRNHECWR